MSSADERIRRLFLEEAEEHVDVLYEGFRALEHDPDGGMGRIEELFRAAHSLKGGAQMLGTVPIAALADRVETVLARIRDGDLTPDPEVTGPLVESAEALADAVRQQRAGEDAAASGPTALLEELAETAGDGSAARVTTTPAPSATHPEGRSSLRVGVGRLDALLERAADVDLAQQRVQHTLSELDRLRTLSRRHGRAWRELSRELDDVRTQLPPRASAAAHHARTTWQEVDETLQAATPAMRTRARELRQAADALGAASSGLRMARLTEACDGLDRSARQSARSRPGRTKSVELSIEGGDVELERQIVTGLRDALNHLVRNAVDHGIETPDERVATGKDEVGQVLVRGRLEGGRAVIDVSDDGRGLDAPALAAAARRRGVAAPETAVADLAFTPGLSTSETVTDVSGRGVGLDAVRARVEQLGGSVELRSEVGEGTTVTMSLPTTLSRFRAVLVEVGGEAVALPASGVNRVVRTPIDGIGSVAGDPTIPGPSGPIRLLSLASALGLGDARWPDRGVVDALVVGPAEDEVALAVDRLVGETESVARDLGERLAGAPGVLGATQLPTGAVALVLNPSACARIGLERGSRPDLTARRDEPRPRRILLVEDSLTTRSLEQAILEAAGYEVVPAIDGVDAWRRLEDEDVDLVVTDVDMPRMNGLALCEAIRRSPRHAELPVVLVTSLAADEDRRRGLEAGANAYLVKSSFDHGELLDLLERLV